MKKKIQFYNNIHIRKLSNTNTYISQRFSAKQPPEMKERNLTKSTFLSHNNPQTHTNA